MNTDTDPTTAHSELAQSASGTLRSRPLAEALSLADAIVEGCIEDAHMLLHDSLRSHHAALALQVVRVSEPGWRDRARTHMARLESAGGRVEVRPCRSRGLTGFDLLERDERGRVARILRRMLREGADL